MKFRGRELDSKKLIKRMGLHGDTLTRTWLDLNSMYIGWDV